MSTMIPQCSMALMKYGRTSRQSGLGPMSKVLPDIEDIFSNRNDGSGQGKKHRSLIVLSVCGREQTRETRRSIMKQVQSVLLRTSCSRTLCLWWYSLPSRIAWLILIAMPVYIQALYPVRQRSSRKPSRRFACVDGTAAGQLILPSSFQNFISVR